MRPRRMTSSRFRDGSLGRFLRHPIVFRQNAQRLNSQVTMMAPVEVASLVTPHDGGAGFLRRVFHVPSAKIESAARPQLHAPEPRQIHIRPALPTLTARELPSTPRSTQGRNRTDA